MLENKAAPVRNRSFPDFPLSKRSIIEVGREFPEIPKITRERVLPDEGIL